MAEQSEEIPEKNPVPQIETQPKAEDAPVSISIEDRIIRLEKTSESISRKLSSFASISRVLERKSSEMETLFSESTNVFNRCISEFQEKAEELVIKLDKEVEYSRNLEDQLALKKSEMDNIILKRHLEENSRKLNKTVSELKENIVNGVSALAQEVKNFQTTETLINEKMTEYNRNCQKATESQMVLFKKDCRESLAKHNDRTEQIKNRIIEFLKKCEEQNESLIKKLPKQKNGLLLKDWFFYAVIAANFLGWIVQMVMTIKLR